VGDRSIPSDTEDDDSPTVTASAAAADTVALRQDPLATAPVGAEQIPFELAVFRREDADRVDVMVCGMWSGATPVLECYEVGETVMVRVLGVDDDRRDPQPYRIVLGVDLVEATVVEVRGTRHSERVRVVDLDGLPVVCGADPSMAGLGETFLHCRGSRLVRVEPNRRGGPGPVRRSSITLVA
jgi:hypothetical protein